MFEKVLVASIVDIHFDTDGKKYRRYYRDINNPDIINAEC